LEAIQMQRLQASNLPTLHSTSGTWGEAQIVSLGDQNVLLDLQTRNYDTTGVLHRQHALANLPIATAIRIRDLLNAAIETALDDPANVQPGLWSDSTIRALAERSRRRAA
jgi:hypothetical protein